LEDHGYVEREREREREREILLFVNGEEGESQHAINREYLVLLLLST
jgi:DNA-binding MarR family transcriptional regulator